MLIFGFKDLQGRAVNGLGLVQEECHGDEGIACIRALNVDLSTVTLTPSAIPAPEAASQRRRGVGVRR